MTGATTMAEAPRARSLLAWPLALRLIVLAAACVIALALAVRLGAVPLTTRQLIDALAGRGDATALTIVRQLRLPRALQAALVGAALAVSGATFQALLRNPLAEPYVLGVSSGAAVGAVITVVTGWALRYVWALPAAAFLGAVLSMLLVLRIALNVSGALSLDTRVLLLAGVVVGAFLVAVIWLVLTFADTESVRSAVFWMMGSNAGASWQTVGILAVCLVPALLVLFALARPLNLLAVGEPTAAYLGVSVGRTKLVAFATATLLTAAAVSVSGAIGFVGLVVPHAIRLLWGSDHRGLLPCSALAGALFLSVTDTLARTVAGANELPIGVVTALIGVPCFVWLLRRPGTI
jgi:iron complex transport system permease protein